MTVPSTCARGFLILLMAFPFVLLHGQDLDDLQDRVVDFWAQWAAGNRQDAALYIEPEGRERFLSGRGYRVVEASPRSFDFTDQRDAVEVRMWASLVLPQVGPVEGTVADRWVWMEGEWYMRMSDTEAVNPFQEIRNPPVERPLPRFEFIAGQIDVERLVQGTRVEGFVDFRGDRAAIRSVLERRSINRMVPGIRFDRPEWIDDESGRMRYIWDTTRVFSDVDAILEFGVQAINGTRSIVSLPLTADIEGRIRIEQVPEAVELNVAGEVAFEIENLSAIPVSMGEVDAANEDYEVVGQLPAELAPGETARIVVTYPAQTRAYRASVAFELDEAFLGTKQIRVPVRFAEEDAADEDPSPIPGMSNDSIRRAIQSVRP